MSWQVERMVRLESLLEKLLQRTNQSPQKSAEQVRVVTNIVVTTAKSGPNRGTMRTTQRWSIAMIQKKEHSIGTKKELSWPDSRVGSAKECDIY